MDGGGKERRKIQSVLEGIRLWHRRFCRVPSQVRRSGPHGRAAATGVAYVSYSPIELMICCAARALENGRSVAVGTGIPCAAAMLAQKTHAPDLVIMFEAGGMAPQLPTMPISVGDSRTFHRGLMA